MSPLSELLLPVLLQVFHFVIIIRNNVPSSVILSRGYHSLLYFPFQYDLVVVVVVVVVVVAAVLIGARNRITSIT